MELSKQCVSLTIAQRLKELGVKQDSYFVHHPIWGVDEIESYGIYHRSLYDAVPKETCSAFTVAELGDLLPLFEVRKKGPDYFRAYSSLVREDDYFMADEGTMADAMGKLLIYLLEQGLL